MAAFAAYCHNCGLAFFAPNLLGGSGTFTLNHTSTYCPRCNSIAELMSGTFTLVDDKVVSLEIPERTRIIYDALIEALQQAQSSTNTSEVVENLENINPFLGSLAKSAIQKGGQGLLILVIILLLNGCHTNLNVDLNQLLNQGYSIIMKSDPTLINGGSAQPSVPEQTQEQSRQQRRHSERQASKQTRSPVRKAPKGSKGGSGKT